MQIYHDYWKEIDKSVNRYKRAKRINKTNSLKYLIHFNRNDLLDNSFEDFKQIVDYKLKNYLNSGLKPSDIILGVMCNYYKKTFTKEELNKISKLNEIYKKQGMPFGVFDYYDLYSVKEVENASNKINSIAHYINSKNLSPLEKIMLCNLIVAKPDYKDNMYRKGESHSLSRSVYSILNNSKRIVCSGYANLFVSIMDTVNDDNIKAFNNEVSVRDGDDTYFYGLHQSNVVYLKDEKYGIDGFYYIDPCWSHDKKSTSKFMLNTTLLSINEIKDLGNIKDYQCGYDFRVRKSKTIHYAHTPIRDKNKNSKYGVSWPRYSSVSDGKVDLYSPSNRTGKTEELFLENYLVSRQDFKDFLVLTEAEKDEQKGRPEKIEKIYNKVQKDPSLSPIYFGKKAVFKYMCEHSKPIDFDKLQSALYKVMPFVNTKLTKDQSSKQVKDIIDLSIKKSKSYYEDNATNELKIMSDSQDEQTN